jgi:hypothetical protein
MDDEIDPSLRMPGEMTPEQQVDAWVQGNPVHNNNRWYSVCDEAGNILRREKMRDGECCPDFSCCSPHLMWPPLTRLAFKNGNKEVRSAMLRGSIQALLADEDLKAHVVEPVSAPLQ